MRPRESRPKHRCIGGCDDRASISTIALHDHSIEQRCDGTRSRTHCRARSELRIPKHRRLPGRLNRLLVVRPLSDLQRIRHGLGRCIQPRRWTVILGSADCRSCASGSCRHSGVDHELIGRHERGQQRRMPDIEYLQSTSRSEFGGQPRRLNFCEHRFECAVLRHTLQFGELTYHRSDCTSIATDRFLCIVAHDVGFFFIKVEFNVEHSECGSSIKCSVICDWLCHSKCTSKPRDFGDLFHASKSISEQPVPTSSTGLHSNILRDRDAAITGCASR